MIGVVPMNHSRDGLGDRMKNFYEKRNQTYLIRRMPVIIRLDGRAFHTLTKHCIKPYDYDLINCMQMTTEFLMKEIQGAKIGYTQSDEISILLTDYDELTTDAWFGYNVQKMVSSAAALASVKFTDEWERLGCFDARCFNIPKEEVNNYFRWRSADWIRNSISMLAQFRFSPKALHGKRRHEQLQMLLDKGVDWHDQQPMVKLGTTYTSGGTHIINWMEESPEIFSELYE